MGEKGQGGVEERGPIRWWKRVGSGGQAIDARLSAKPLTFGEVYRLNGVIEERLAVLEFLAIDFAVDTQRNFVLVRDCRFLSRPDSGGAGSA